MRWDRLGWALSGLRNWIPALIALEPGAMAYTEAMRAKDTSTSTEGEAFRHLSGEPVRRSQFWAKGFGE